jgi:Tfp pilus assembly protein PilV
MSRRLPAPASSCPLSAPHGVAAGIRPRVPPRGFTIVEVIVAMTLLVSGALAVVAATAAAVRAVGSADAQLLAMSLAQSRLEALASRGCSGAAGGTAADSSSELREWWEVSRARNGVRLAIDSVAYTDHGIRRVVVRRRLLVC